MADDDRPVLVTGGTGTLGRALVHTLLDQGRPVRVLSRRGRTPAVPDEVEWAVGDLLTGDGLPAALGGVSAVVHCASNPRKPDEDVEAAVQLTLAGRATGLPHLVYISIVGVDVVPYVYYAAKARVEEIVEDSGLPWTILRATQFHEFVEYLLGALTMGPLSMAPKGLTDQPVEVREVAARLVSLLDVGPSGRAPDMGGPQVLTVHELLRTWLAARGRRARIVPIPSVGRLKVFSGTGHLAPEHATGRLTFAEWAEQKY